MENKFKIRCSAINNIMTKPTKNNIVSAGAKTYCKKWLTEQIYNRKEQISSKYMLKGTTVEDESISFIAKELDYKKIRKNYKSFENDFLTGTPDVITKNEIIEVKSSWNCFTFPLLEDDIPTKGYNYQAQGYMHLTGHKKAKLIYTLIDTPKDLIESEFWKQHKSYPSNFNGDIHSAFPEFEKDYLYNDIKEKYKIKIYEIDYDETIIESIKERVEACKEYIKTLLEKIN